MSFMNNKVATKKYVFTNVARPNAVGSPRSVATLSKMADTSVLNQQPGSVKPSNILW